LKLRGLYAITPDAIDTESLCRQVEQALAGGVVALQYRNKLLAKDKRLAQAHRLAALAHGYGVPFIVNDDVEIALCREALRRDLPTLAICRGHQLLNVATGGTLFQDIASQVEAAVVHDPDQERWERCHDVDLLPGTRLRDILGRERVAVNSFHHQAVKSLGRHLRDVGWAPDQVVEAVEHEDRRRFVIAVQWHPEDLVGHDAAARALFAAVVDAARARGRS